MHDIDTGAEPEALTAEVRRGADTTEEKFSAPGLAFAAATRSATPLYPFAGDTTSTLGEAPTRHASEIARRVVRQLAIDGGRNGMRIRVHQNVWPSGSALATNAAPIVPPAPARLSTTMG